ncbi:BTB/POZ domain [Teratosphaeria destructans]|uniref:BTB/POZ domain n=1 Tax=Teratosphaeria destructans TaxID=418781 RepID=A0A9W7SWF0_9PEZI|nr:BTB/POZ domain [Teratosphaeria destructans]
MAAPPLDRRVDKLSLRDFTDNIIKIKVGPDGKDFAVHEKLLRSGSEFFDIALKQRWKEGQEGTVHLPMDRADLFARFAEWLYSGRVVCKDGLNFGLDVLGELYVLGETLLAPAFQNQIIDAIVSTQRMHNKFAGIGEIGTIYNGTPVGSPARKLMVEYYARYAAGTWFLPQNAKDAAHPEFLFDLVVALADKRPAAPYRMDDPLARGLPTPYYKSTSRQA